MTHMDVPAANPRPFSPKALQHAGREVVRILPGVALCAAVTGVAYAVEAGEQRLFGRAWLEALVMAILIGTALRSLWTPGLRWRCGIEFSAKILLEVAVMLLGAAISFRTLAAVGPGLLFGIAGVVALVIPTSFLICRALGLPRRMAILVACGNSICGNSAIAAVAPVIGADGDDVAASIAFTGRAGACWWCWAFPCWCRSSPSAMRNSAFWRDSRSMPCRRSSRRRRRSGSRPSRSEPW